MELKGCINKEDNIMDNNVEQVDWGKVNRGKVRYGFALELYKRGGDLKPSEIGKIEAFVEYVMEGPDYYPTDEGKPDKSRDRKSTRLNSSH